MQLEAMLAMVLMVRMGLMEVICIKHTQGKEEVVAMEVVVQEQELVAPVAGAVGLLVAMDTRGIPWGAFML